MCVSICASWSTQRPSQSPLTGREHMQRSNEGVISLAWRLLHYQLMDSPPSVLTGSAGYSLETSFLSVWSLREWLNPSCCEVEFLLSACLASCSSDTYVSL